MGVTIKSLEVDIVIAAFALLFYVLSQSTSDIYYTKGSAVDLECPIEGDFITWLGPPNLTIYAVGHDVDAKINSVTIHRRTNLNKYILQITKLTTATEGSYRCYGYSESVDFNVMIKENPTNLRITNKTEAYVYAVEGQSLFLECTVKPGKPAGNITWNTAENVILQVGGPDRVVYRLVTTRNDHKNVYVCEAYNSDGIKWLNDTVQLFVFYRPSVTISSKPSLILDEGSNLTLTCDVDGNDPFAKVEWNMKTANTVGNELKFEKIKRDDAGRYTCKVVMSRGGEAENTTTVVVQYAPTVSINYAATEPNKKLICIAKGVPDRYTYKNWEHRTGANDHIRFIAANNSDTLIIPFVAGETNRHNDRGIYICRVSNNVTFDGELFVSGHIQLNDTGAPYFVTSNRDIQYGILGENATIVVEFVSSMTISEILVDGVLTSHKDHVEDTFVPDIVYGKNVSVKSKRLNWQIEINSITDFRIYSVRVSNAKGSQHFTVNLTSADRPKAPTELTAIPFSDSILVTWKPGFDGGYAQTFIVEYRRSIDTKWKNASVMFVSKTTIDGLEPYTEYYIRMFSRNMINDSDLTPEILIRTKNKPKASDNAVYGIFILIVLILLVCFIVAYWQYKKGILDGVLLRVGCVKRPTDRNEPGIFGVENNFYEMQNNLGVNVQRQSGEVPVYSSIERRANLNPDQCVSYAVSQKKKPNPLGHRKDKKDDGIVQTNIHGTKCVSGRKNVTDEKETRQLNYVDVCFDQKPGHRFEIRGLDQKSSYVDIDFSKRVNRLPSSDVEDVSDDDFESANDIKEMKKKN